MKKINLEPVIVDESTIVQYTDKVTVEKGLSLIRSQRISGCRFH